MSHTSYYYLLVDWNCHAEWILIFCHFQHKKLTLEGWATSNKNSLCKIRLESSLPPSTWSTSNVIWFNVLLCWLFSLTILKYTHTRYRKERKRQKGKVSMVNGHWLDMKVALIQHIGFSEAMEEQEGYMRRNKLMSREQLQFSIIIRMNFFSLFRH